MKKIIKGKLYDTDKAEFLGYDLYAGPRDFHYWREELYRKRTGEYFIYGKGGPDSKYAVASVTGSGWDGGEKIIPLTLDKAREWVENHLSASQYAEIFGMPDEGSAEKVTICMQIPSDLDAIIRAKAAEKGVSLTAYVTEVLNRACRA